MSTEIVKQNNAMVAPPSSIIEASLQLPERDMVEVKNRLVEMATCDPEVARGAIYCVPVGKDPDTGLQKFKLGESIRLAEMGQGAFGRMFMDVQTDERSKDSVTMKAMLMDLQTLNIYTGIGTARIYNEARAKLAIAAATSIAKRNAILSMIRPYTNAILPDIKACIVRSLSEEGSVKEALDKLLAEFAELGVTEQQVKAAVANEKDNVDRVVILIGILNSIRDHMVSVEDAFGEPQMKEPQAKRKPQTSKPKPQKKKKQEPEPEEPESEDEIPGDEEVTVTTLCESVKNDGDELLPDQRDMIELELTSMGDIPGGPHKRACKAAGIEDPDMAIADMTDEQLCSYYLAVSEEMSA